MERWQRLAREAEGEPRFGGAGRGARGAGAGAGAKKYRA
jgi:hypothetical protein